jgi:hypothetical protein
MNRLTGSFGKIQAAVPKECAMPFRAPLDEFRFIFAHVSDFQKLPETALFNDATPDMVDAILNGAGRICEEVMAPLRRPGDMTPAKLENGVVRTSPGHAEAFRALAEGGWVALSAPQEYGGMGLPLSLTTAFNEMAATSAMGLGLCPLLTQGQIEALEHHASDEMKALYLPKLISGEWTGTMAMAPMPSAVRKSTSLGVTTILAAISAILCWRACPMGRRGQRALACLWCPNTCPMHRATRAWPTALRW